MVRSAVIVAVSAGLVAGCGDTGSRPASGPPVTASGEGRGLGLTRSPPRAYRTVCREQAAYAPAGARECPPLVPAGPVSVQFAGPFSTLERLAGGFSADFETELGHWHFDAAWTEAVERAAADRAVERPVNATAPSSCRAARLHAEAVRVCRVVPFERGGGLHGGHVAYVWRTGPATFVVSLHGYRHELRVRAMMRALIAEVRD